MCSAIRFIPSPSLSLPSECINALQPPTHRPTQVPRWYQVHFRDFSPPLHHVRPRRNHLRIPRENHQQRDHRLPDHPGQGPTIDHGLLLNRGRDLSREIFLRRQHEWLRNRSDENGVYGSQDFSGHALRRMGGAS